MYAICYESVVAPDATDRRKCAPKPNGRQMTLCDRAEPYGVRPGAGAWLFLCMAECHPSAAEVGVAVVGTASPGDDEEQPIAFHLVNGVELDVLRAEHSPRDAVSQRILRP